MLVGHAGVSWREWLKNHRGKSDLLCLDPAEGTYGFLGRLPYLRGAKPVFWRFYGSYDPQRSPHIALAALGDALHLAAEDLIVQLAPYRPSPVLRHSVALLAQVLRPDQILMANGTELDGAIFPIGPEEIELPAAEFDIVRDAQRKAQWIATFDKCTEQEVDLNQVAIEGSRLGTGKRVEKDVLTKIGFGEALYAERAGGILLVIDKEEPDEAKVSRAIDVLGVTKVQFVKPLMLRNLLCSFARQSGEDFGTGILLNIDWENRKADVLCSAVPPAPVHILKLGSLRVDAQGKELGELRPWQV